MVCGHGDVLDIGTFEEAVIPFLVLCIFISYHTFRSPGLADYLLGETSAIFSDVPYSSGHASAHPLRYALATTC